MAADMKLVVNVVARVSQLRSGMAGVRSEVERTGDTAARAANRAGSSVHKLAAASLIAGKAIIAGVGGAMAVSAKAAMDFESAFTGVQKTVEGSRQQFGALADSLVQLSKDIPVAASELARIAELGGQLGVGIGNITEFSETIAKLGATTNLSAEQAALGFARFANIMGVAQSDFDQLGDVIVELGNNLPATENEILQLGLRLAPIATVAKASADEVFALSATLAAVGQPAERAGTAIQRTIVQMQQAIALGTDDLKLFAEVAGMSMEEFGKLFQQSSIKALEAFVTGLNKMGADGAEATIALSKLGVTGVRQQQVLLALASASSTFSTALADANYQMGEGSALTEEANKRFLDTRENMKMTANAVSAVARAFGEELTPELRVASEAFRDWLEEVDAEGWANEWGDAIGDTIVLVKLWGDAAKYAKAQWDAWMAQGAETFWPFAGSSEAAVQEAAQARSRVAAMNQVHEAVKKTGDEIEITRTALRNMLQDAVIGDEGIIFAEDISDALRELTLRYKLTDKEIKQITDTLTKSGKAYGLNAEQIALLIELVKEWTGETEGSGDSWERMGIKLKVSSKVMTTLEKITIDLIGKQKELAEATRMVVDAQNEAVGGVTDFIGSLVDLAQAKAAVDEDNSIENMLDYSDAFSAATEAAVALTETGLEPYLDRVEEMHRLGLITSQQLQEERQRILDAGVAYAALVSEAGNSTVAFDLLLQVATEMGVEVGALIAKLYGLDAAMAANIGTSGDFARAMMIAASTVPVFAMSTQVGTLEEFAKIQEVARKLRGTFTSAGTELGKFFNSGFGKEVTKGSGEAMKDAGADAARKWIEGYRSVLNLRQAEEDLADARRRISELNDEYNQAFEDYWRIFNELQEARREAAKVTTEELADIVSSELDVLRTERRIYELRKEIANIPQEMAEANERLAEAQEAYNDAMEEAARLERDHAANMTNLQAELQRMIRSYAAGDSTFADLIAAEADLAAELLKGGDAAEVRADAEEALADAQQEHADTMEELAWRQREATLELRLAELELILAEQELNRIREASTGTTQEVIDLEEELIDAQDRLREIREESAEAQKDVINAELDLMEAMMDTKDAAEALADLDPKMRQFFDNLVAKVGGAKSAIAQMRAEIEATLATFGAAVPQSTGTAPAAAGGSVAVSNTTGGSKIVAVTSKPKPLNPGIKILHGGGFLPGPPSQEYMAVLRGGEAVLDANQIINAMATAVSATADKGVTVIVQLDGDEIGRYAARDFMNKIGDQVKVARRIR